MKDLTHLDEKGAARMVDVGEKPETPRSARARGSVRMAPSAYTRAREGDLPKGDITSTARIAGIQGAKLTPALIPLCHPIQLDSIALDFEWDDKTCTVNVIAASRARSRTGVEMEALTACAVTCLTLYDMVKGLDRGATIGPIVLLEKEGGKSGSYRRRSRCPP